MVTGYRPYIVLSDALKQIDPEILINNRIDTEDYLNYYGTLTEKEIQEIQENK